MTQGARRTKHGLFPLSGHTSFSVFPLSEVDVCVVRVERQGIEDLVSLSTEPFTLPQCNLILMGPAALPRHRPFG